MLSPQEIANYRLEALRLASSALYGMGTRAKDATELVAFADKLAKFMIEFGDATAIPSGDFGGKITYIDLS